MPRPQDDPKAIFEILVRENSDMLLTYLRAAMWDASAVDDVFQETMLTAWRRLDDSDRTRPFGPWLRGIAGKLVLAHGRKHQRNPIACEASVLEHLEQQVQHISKRSGDTWEEKIAELRACIDALPNLAKEAIDMRYMQKQPPRVIAELLSISGEALKKRLQRARAMLLECLQNKGVIPESVT